MSIITSMLGRTGLEVTLVGLGAGGNSRLGLAYGRSEEEASAVVTAALELGVGLVDTARVYQTEGPVGRALHAWRAAGNPMPLLSSKSPYLDREGRLLSAAEFRQNIETSLRQLQVACIDIYFIHGLRLDFYEAARQRFLPVLQQARQEGLLRFFGLTEAFESDTRHEMLQHAVQDDAWDVVMVGFNLLNPSARERVLAKTMQQGTGTFGMFAVRRALIDESWLRTLLQRLGAQGEVDPALAAAPDLLSELGLREGDLERPGCRSLSEAAYRFAAFEPGLDCVLVGTGSAEHLRANLEAVARGPLTLAAQQRLKDLFGRIDSVSGQVR